MSAPGWGITPNTGRSIYEDAAEAGLSWYEAGVMNGLTGDHLKVAVAAQRIARGYAKMYSRPWPVEDVDARDGAETLRLAQEGTRWSEIVSRLGYASEEQAREHMRSTAVRVGVDTSGIERTQFGRLAYERRLVTPDWSQIAAEMGSMENTVKVAAGEYAQATGREWPLRYKPPEWGRMAYDRRAESMESWKTIAADFGLDWEYLSKEAKEYAQANGRPWPMPTSPRLFRDTGAEAYALRAEKRLSWEEIGERLGVSRAWALRMAQRHVGETGAEWPIRTVDAESVEETAYALRTQGNGWDEVAQTMMCSHGVAQDRARRFAVRTGRPWPIVMPPVRKSFSARAKEAYDRGYVGKESWHDLAEALGYANGQSCQNSARVYAERFGLPLHIRRRGRITRDEDRPRRAYEARVANPTASWGAIGKGLGYKVWRSAYTAARNWATTQGLPWPLPEVSNDAT